MIRQVKIGRSGRVAGVYGFRIFPGGVAGDESYPAPSYPVLVRVEGPRGVVLSEFKVWDDGPHWPSYVDTRKARRVPVRIVIDPENVYSTSIRWDVVYADALEDELGVGVGGNSVNDGVQRVQPIGAVTKGTYRARWLQAVMFDDDDTAGALRVARPGRVLYDSGAVAGGVAIDSPVLDLTAIDALYVVANNAAGAAPRNLGYTDYLDDGATVIDAYAAFYAVPAAGFGKVAAGLGVGPGSMSANKAGPLPTKSRWSLAAGGVGNGRLTIWGR